jgi:hypothetical protein
MQLIVHLLIGESVSDLKCATDSNCRKIRNKSIPELSYGRSGVVGDDLESVEMSVVGTVVDPMNDTRKVSSWESGRSVASSHPSLSA